MSRPLQSVVIKRERVALGEPGPAPAGRADARAQAHPPFAAPSVRPIEQGGMIVALELTCSCGEVSLVELRYPSNPESQP